MRTLCGIRLNIIGIIIGSIYLLQSIIGSISLILNLVKYTKDKKEAIEDGIAFDEDREIISMLSTSVSLTLTFVLTSPLLIWGSVKKKCLFLIPWLFNSLVCIIINGLYLFAAILKLFINQEKPEDTQTHLSAFQFIILFVAFAFQMVLYKVIHLLYKELIFEQELRDIGNSGTIYIVYEEMADQG